MRAARTEMVQGLKPTASGLQSTPLQEFAATDTRTQASSSLRCGHECLRSPTADQLGIGRGELGYPRLGWDAFEPLSTLFYSSQSLWASHAARAGKTTFPRPFPVSTPAPKRPGVGGFPLAARRARFFSINGCRTEPACQLVRVKVDLWPGRVKGAPFLERTRPVQESLRSPASAGANHEGFVSHFTGRITYPRHQKCQSVHTILQQPSELRDVGCISSPCQPGIGGGAWSHRRRSPPTRLPPDLGRAAVPILKRVGTAQGIERQCSCVRGRRIFSFITVSSDTLLLWGSLRRGAQLH